MKRSHWFALYLVLFAATAATVLGEDGNRKKFLTKPLVIEDQGSFFIGGVSKVTNYATLPAPNAPNQTLTPNEIMIGQMYVQFQIPARKAPNVPPVIMVHGSTHTGACLESTPDGREGWEPYFVRRGISTYVVDQAGRGRSGFDESVLHEAATLIKKGDKENGLSEIPIFGRITDNGAWNAWFGHTVPAGSTLLTGKMIQHGDPGDPDKNEIHGENYHPAYPLAAVYEYYKQLVPNAEVTLPGSRCETCDPKELAPANTWTPRDMALLVEKLGGAIVATHSQSGIMGHHMLRLLKERGHLDMVKALITIEGSCSLPNSGLKPEDFDNIPYLALKGDYTPTSEACQATVDAINARRALGKGTAKAEYIKLDELSNPVFNGTTHMMMLGTNNLDVADVILKWVDTNVTKKSKRP